MMKKPLHFPFLTRHARCLVPAAILLFVPLASPLPATEPEALADVLDQIQRECLAAYPEDMLAEMASGAQEIPSKVEEDPKVQMQFLDKEIPRDKGLFYPSLLEDLLPAFQRYVKPEVGFLDLGSGDGRIVFLAGVLGAQATGIEYDEELVAVSLRALEALEDLVDPERVRIVQGDFFKESWSGYDVIYYFDQSSFAQDRVRDKLRRELDPGAILLVGHEQAPFPGLELETAFPNLEAKHPDVTVYRRGAAPPPEPAAAPPSGGEPGTQKENGGSGEPPFRTIGRTSGR